VPGPSPFPRTHLESAGEILRCAPWGPQCSTRRYRYLSFIAHNSDEHGNSEPYLWFAYFWGDATSISNDDENRITVFVPSVPDTRAQYPDNIGNSRDIPIPADVGRFGVEASFKPSDP